MKTLLTAALLAGAALSAGCRRGDPAPPAPDPLIHGNLIEFPASAPQLASLAVEPVAPSPCDSTRLFGRLTWDEDATVRVFTPFAGRVRRVIVDYGADVSRGAPLAELDSPDFGEAQAEARTAESDERLAERNLRREQELFDHGAAARKDLEAAEADAERASSQRARASARLQSCGASADSVNGVFMLRSPIAGTVVERTLTPGQEVRPDQMLANAPQMFSPLFVISDPSRLWIRIEATEAELPCLRPGTTFHFGSSAFPERQFEARIDHVSATIDPGTHTIEARGTVLNPTRELKAEMFVSAEIPNRGGAAASVPSRAVFLRGDRHYVFVEERPGRFTCREVRVSAEQNERVLVSAGVQAGERVVTSGSVLLARLID